MNRIQKYLNLVAETLDSAYRLSGVSSHNPDIGFNRETKLKDFLERHLPKRLTPFLGGQIIGVSGSVSKQIDIIVANDIAIRFQENERTFINIEGVAGAITVKSTLNSADLKDCLTNLASIPPLSREVVTFPFIEPDPFDKYILLQPALYVFAYSGMALEETLEN